MALVCFSAKRNLVFGAILKFNPGKSSWVIPADKTLVGPEVATKVQLELDVMFEDVPDREVLDAYNANTALFSANVQKFDIPVRLIA